MPNTNSRTKLKGFYKGIGYTIPVSLLSLIGQKVLNFKNIRHNPAQLSSINGVYTHIYIYGGN